MRPEMLEELAVEIESVKAESRLVVVDFANVGDVCEWLLAEFPGISIIYSNQQLTRIQDRQFSASPRDMWYIDRAAKLDPLRARPMSLNAETLLERLGGRRFDFVICREPHTNDTDAQEWVDLFRPVVTGKLFLDVNGRLTVVEGGLPIPERRPLPRFESMEGVTVEGDLPDVNRFDKYKRRS